MTYIISHVEVQNQIQLKDGKSPTVGIRVESYRCQFGQNEAPVSTEEYILYNINDITPKDKVNFNVASSSCFNNIVVTVIPPPNSVMIERSSSFRIGRGTTNSVQIAVRMDPDNNQLYFVDVIGQTIPSTGACSVSPSCRAPMEGKSIKPNSQCLTLCLVVILFIIIMLVIMFILASRNTKYNK